MSANEPATAKDVNALLEEPAVRSWRRPAVWVSAGLVVLAALGTYFWWTGRNTGTAPHYLTERVEPGDVILTITANGTLQPTRSVNIGSELSGAVARVFVDVNDRVKKNQVLVELDTAKLSDQILRSRASLAAANAKVAQAAATVKETESNLARLEDVSRLSSGKVPSMTELDAARATLQRALAEETSARADVANATAALSTDETNLAKASIRSPIDGVVLTRSVEPGNAVAASLQAVTLFSIAEDLSKLRLLVNIDEADVGAAAVGQKAVFTVSAYPNRQFPATIIRIAYGSTITDNVVTYLTYLDVDNADLNLRPGMTATATITATERHGVLRVPNSALRFSPAQTSAVGASGSGAPGGIVSSLMPRIPRTRARNSAASTASISATHQVWVLRGNSPEAVAITTGITDGRMTEITAGDLQEGTLVITAQGAGMAP